jgi:hypothetical protein
VGLLRRGSLRKRRGRGIPDTPRAFGWNVVPRTWLRDGPLGREWCSSGRMSIEQDDAVRFGLDRRRAR